MNKTSLKDIVSGISAIYESLNQLADTKTNALQNNDIKTLDNIMQQEEVYNKKILKLLEARDEFFSENKELSETESKEVEVAVKELALVSEEFSKKNELNQSLVRQSLYYVNMNLNMLAPQENPDTYSPQNKKNSRKPNRVFMDSRV